MGTVGNVSILGVTDAAAVLIGFTAYLTVDTIILSGFTRIIFGRR